MQQNGNRIVPLNSLLAATTVRGEPVHASLADARAARAAQGVEIGMVDVFRKSADVPPVADGRSRSPRVRSGCNSASCTARMQGKRGRRGSTSLLIAA